MKRQFPFAGFVKKLTVGRVIAVLVIMAMGFGIGEVKDWSEVREARVDLASEIGTYRADHEVRMAWLTYNLAKSYLSEEDRGRYQQRLEYVTSPDRGLFVIHGDTPSSVVDGLFDGIDLAGTTSTAELAKLLRAPVVICVDCTKSSRTMAAPRSRAVESSPCRTSGWDPMCPGAVFVTPGRATCTWGSWPGTICRSSVASCLM